VRAVLGLATVATAPALPNSEVLEAILVELRALRQDLNELRRENEALRRENEQLKALPPPPRRGLFGWLRRKP
jgi:cell division protein FtsB